MSFPASRLWPVALGHLLALGSCAMSADQATDDKAVAEPEAVAEPGSVAPALELNGDYLPAEIATVGWDAFTSSPIVLLRELDTGHVVPIWIGFAEARAIAAALHGVEYPRPMTHDLMSNLLSELHAVLEEVVIHDLREGTYYGMLKLRIEDRAEPLLVDTRPSDGLALALRQGAAIRVAKTLLDDAPDYEFMAPDSEEQVVRALGLTVVAPSEEMRQEFGLPERSGLVVTRVAGRAAEKGLRRGDLIVQVNDVVPQEPMDFLDVVRKSPLGQPIHVTYWRGGEEFTVELYPDVLEEEDGPKRVA